MLRRLIVALAVVSATLVLESVAFAGPGTVAVLYFQNEGNPQLEPLKVGLAQMLITDMQGTEGLTIVERSQLQAILDELELGHSGKVDRKTAAKVGKLLGAEFMVMGSYFELLGTLRIDARLVKVETSEILYADGLNNTVDKFMGMEKELARTLRAALTAAAADSAATPTKRGKTTPTNVREPDPAPNTRSDENGTSSGGGGNEPEITKPNPEALSAAVAFSEGLIYLDKKDAPRARESFEKAIAANPELTLAKAELAAMEL